MSTIEAIIERAKDGTYTVYCKHEIFSGAGETIAQAKADMHRQMAFYKETAQDQGFKCPEFLNGPFEITYQVDMPSLLRYYVEAGIFSLAGVEKMTGINQKQLWAYLHGTKPRKTQADRMEKGFRNLMEDLDSVFVSA